MLDRSVTFERAPVRAAKKAGPFDRGNEARRLQMKEIKINEIRNRRAPQCGQEYLI